jgi:alkanesulfonate monooxygenase SsuD/methylene tetrahydromethanopterin reductase-like flavin-dependent oxidoreductase (luciferase family)
MPEARKIEIGIGIGGMSHGQLGVDVMIEAATNAEKEGYDFLTLADHMLWRHPTLDSLIVMGLILANTNRIKVGTVLLVPLRHPTITAKMVGTLDHVAPGRVFLIPAVGGDYSHEYVSCGVKVSERAGRTNESLEIMRLLWTGEEVNYEGRYYRIQDATMLPPPVQPGGPPFWLAHRGKSEAAIRRTARLGQGWFASWVSPGSFQRVWNRTLEYAQGYGRDPSTLTPASIIRIYVSDNKEDAIERTSANRTRIYGHAGNPGMADHLQCLGTPQQCAEKLQAFLDAGLTHIHVEVPAPPEEQDEQLKSIVRDVLPLVGINLGASR